jgi:hypothetical protein
MKDLSDDAIKQESIKKVGITLTQIDLAPLQGLPKPTKCRGVSID